MVDVYKDQRHREYTKPSNGSFIKGSGIKRYLSKFLASFMSLVILAQPTLVVAQQIQTDSAAAAANQPQVDTAGNGVPIVDIVTPNALGLSHNKYLKFSVGADGAILNNSNQNLSQSQLGGLVQGNANLATSGPASVILNEVTSANRSALNGTTEVHGASANVIIANPNGITCDGCGFINTPRVTLSTGTPEINVSGALENLKVEGGDILFGSNGANLGTVNVFDIVSRTISIQGPIQAGSELNLIAGRNSYAYQTGLITPLTSDGSEPAIAIDSSLLGGMYAGKIKIISTDQGAGVRAQGQMAANTDSMTLTASGKLIIGKVQAKKKITVRSQQASVQVQSTLFSEEAIELEGLTSVELAANGLVAAQGDVTLEGQSVIIGQDALVASGVDVTGAQSATGVLTVQATTLTAGNGRLAAGEKLAITADTIDIARAINTNTDSFRSLGQTELNTSTLVASNALIASAGLLSVKALGALNITGGLFTSNGNIVVEGVSVNSSGDLSAKKTLNLTGLSGAVVNSGNISGDTGVAIASGAGITNSGDIFSLQNVDVRANGALSNEASGRIVGNGDVKLTASAITSAGHIGAQGGVLGVDSLGALDNSGTISAHSSAALNVDGAVINSGDINVEDDLVLKGLTGVRTGTLKNEAGGIINAGNVSIASANLDNKGRLTAYYSQLTADLTGNLDNSGTFEAKTDIDVALGGNIANSGTIISEQSTNLEGLNGDAFGSLTNSNSATLNGGTGLTVKATWLNNAGGAGSSGGAVDIALTGNLDNTGLLYSSTSSNFSIDGTFTNTDADILAGTDLTIEGLNGVRTGAFNNIRGDIEAETGNITIKSASVNNTGTAPVLGTSIAATSSVSGDTTTTVTKTTEIVTTPAVSAKLLSGSNIIIDTGNLTNTYSQIAANGDIDIAATSVTNVGRNLIETTVTEAITQHSERYCSLRIIICLDHDTRYWTTSTSNTSTAPAPVESAIFGTIEAGETLNAIVTGHLANNAVRGNAGLVSLTSGAGLAGGAGLASGGGALGDGSVDGTSGVANLISLPRLNVIIDKFTNRSALFDVNLSPNAPYLIETSPEFVDRSNYFGSDYFLSRVGDYNSDNLAKRLGDGYVETRFVLDQIFNLTGKRYLGNADSTQALIQALFDNALIEQGRLDLNFGVALTASQIASLKHDIIWLETQVIQGQDVLIPRLYLASATLNNLDILGGQIRAGQIIVNAQTLTNSGTFSSLSNLQISTSGAVINRGGNLLAKADIIIDTNGLFVNLSGNVIGENTIIVAGTVINDTFKIRDFFNNGFADRLQQSARIEGRKSLLISAIGSRDSSVSSSGGEFVSGGDVEILSAGDVSLEALQLESQSNDIFDGGYNNLSTITNKLASIKSGGNIEVDSEGTIVLRGASVSAQDDTTLVAQGDIEIASVQDYRNEDFKLDIKGGGLFGTGLFGVETNIKRQTASLDTNVNSLEIGGDLTIISKTGNITLDAPKITVGGKAVLTSDEGTVGLESNTDNSFSMDFKREEDLLWWNQRDQGNSVDEVVHTLIETGGGLIITAKDGVRIEYRETGDLNASIDQLSKLEGLAWMGDLRNRNDVNWQAIIQAQENWDYKTQGLTEAGAALVALAVSIATSGVGSGFAAGLGFAEGTVISAAMEAGITSLASQASVSLINNQGDIGAVLAELGSNASLKSLISSMLTAGLTTGVLNVKGIPNTSPTLSFGENFVNAAQRNLIKAAIRVGIQITIEGRPLDQSLVSALRLAAADTLGSSLAIEIGKSFNGGQINKASQLIAHAALGCATGSISSNDCTGGAAGAVAGEIAAELFVTNWTKSVLKRAQAGELTRQELANEIASLDSKAINIASLTGGLMAALVGGDVNAGSAAGSNAAEYNALCGGICIGLIATIIGYMTYSGDGDPSEGLAVMGSGDDPLSVAVAAGTSAAVEWSAIEFPETTQAILSILEVTGGAIDATVTYVDDATGNEVSRRWNEIPEHTRNQIKGGGKIISIFVPAGSIKALKQLKNAKRAGNRGVGKYLSDNWYKGTFPNNKQSVAYHLKRHGKGRTASEYTKDAQDFFSKNKNLGQPTTLKDGTLGIKIQTKTKVNGRTVRVGGYWTSSGKLVTFWD